MRTQKYDGTEMRTALAGMIMDRSVCARIATQWTPEGLFDAGWANLVGGLVVKHFRKFDTNPNGQFTGIFEQWASQTTVDPKTIDAIERFIQCLSDEYREEPADYVMDVAGRYFNRVKTEREIKLAQTELERGQVEEAQARLQQLGKVNLGVGAYIEPAADPGIWIDSFSEERRRPLVRYRHDLGKFIGDSLTRDALYSFMAPDKTGKTTWLRDLAYRAVRQRNRVAFFDTGDGSREEVLIGIACRTLGRPEYAGRIDIPIEWDDKGPVMSNIAVDAADPIDGYRSFRRLCKREDAFRVSCHENSTVSINDIESILEEWERAGWRPDVVVIDYADILAPIKGIRDPLEQIDETWKGMRRLSQRRHVLVVTATQASADAYDLKTGLLSKRHFSGRKTKIAHVNGMLGINVSHDEKDVDSCRINWIVRRRGRYNEKHFVRVAGCMAIGNPSIISKL